MLRRGMIPRGLNRFLFWPILREIFRAGKRGVMLSTFSSRGRTTGRPWSGKKQVNPAARAVEPSDRHRHRDRQRGVLDLDRHARACRRAALRDRGIPYLLETLLKIQGRVNLAFVHSSLRLTLNHPRGF